MTAVFVSFIRVGHDVGNKLAIARQKFDSNVKQQIQVRILAAGCARGLRVVVPRKKREQGMPDARCTRGLACKTGNENAHEHTGSAEALRHSLRNGFTAYTALSSASEFVFVTVAAGLTADRPGWIDFATDSLAPATGVGTTRFCRTQQRRSSARRSIAHGSGSIQNPPCHSLARLTLPRPPHPIPTFVTMANAPSSGTGWRES
jgi:hypothetical protein